MSGYDSFRAKRRESDYIMPVWLPFLPIIISIIGEVLIAILYLATLITTVSTVSEINSTMITNGTIISTPVTTTPPSAFPSIISVVGILLVPYLLLGIVSSALIGYVIYRLLKRYNDHAMRVKGMFNSANFDGRLNGAIGEMGKLQKRDPTEWAVIIGVLGVIPFLSIISLILIAYIFHSLNKDFYRLEYIENNAYVQLGWKGERYKKMPDRSTILYIVLTIVTLGIFGLYWVYTIAQDPNEHFREDWRIEDSITPPGPETAKPSPGGQPNASGPS